MTGWSINECAVALRGFAHPKARRILNIYEQTRKHIAGGLFDDNTQSQKMGLSGFLTPQWAQMRPMPNRRDF